MLKRLSYMALLMGVSLRAMEGALEADTGARSLQFLSDERISAQLSQLLESKLQISDTGQEDTEGGSPIREVSKKVSSSAGELPRGSGGELPELSELDNLRGRIFRLVQERRLELDEEGREKLVEEMLRELLTEHESDVSHSINREGGASSGLEENASDKAAREQTGSGAGCWGGDLREFREKDIHTPGDRVKPPESTTPDFPHMP